MHRFLEEQPPDYAPTSVEVLPDKLVLSRVVTRRSLVFGAVAAPQVSTLYWDSLGKSELLRKRGWFIVDVFDRDQHLFLEAYSHSEDKAHRFIDALESLKTSP